MNEDYERNIWFDSAVKIYVNPDEKNEKISTINIDETVKKNLYNKGIKSLYPLQNQLLKFTNKSSNYFKRKRDICICSPTGSGKTLCYILPIIETQLRFRSTTTLIVAPSNSLCRQISEVFKELIKNTNMDIKINETNNCKHTIWISTPFKVADLLLEKKVNTKNLIYIILDECDKLFDQKHREWQTTFNQYFESNIKTFTIENWMESSKPFPQKIFLSATLKDNPDFISEMHLFQPIIFFTGNQNGTTIFINTKLKEKLLLCEQQYNPIVLVHILSVYLKSNPNSAILCFANDTHVVIRISQLLTQYPDFRVAKQYADMKYNKKISNLNSFLCRKSNIMITTDSLSRGLDFINVGLVINYDYPQLIDNYVHRVGRTCRGNQSGTIVIKHKFIGLALTLVPEQDHTLLLEQLSKVERETPIEVEKININEMKYLKKWYTNASNNIK
ncbi:hypothetical protein MXB_3440 [Myxobolus squamalis]|nr:hypothetical protein MXB_3440 [Myxobolus squamalis]